MWTTYLSARKKQNEEIGIDQESRAFWQYENLEDEIPLVGHQHGGVAAVGDAAIPEDAVVGELHLVTVVLLRVLAEVALEAGGREAAHAHPVPDLESAHVGPDLRDHPCDLMPGTEEKKNKMNKKPEAN